MTVIDEVKERTDIVEVVGRYVALKKSGRNYKALCPFHNEKTPSFFVFPDTGTWRCFGACSVGGDVISFIEKKENMIFADALRMLGQSVGVDVDKDQDPKVLSRLNQLRELNQVAAQYFQHQLLQTATGTPARSYLEGRAVTAKTIEQFQIGYAPPGWENLVSYMRRRDHTLDDLETVGLVGRREDGSAYDRFRNRIIFPIRDIQSHIIGFGGRVLDDDEPKYLNSPETPLFDKSTVIYGLDMAKRYIHSKNQAILVEGYMDVISAYQRGFKNVVAAMGTSVTPQQLQRLSRYSRNFVFALDADTAGINATLRSIHVVRETLASPTVPVPTAKGYIQYEQRLKATIKIAAMAPGMDPDDVLRQDPGLWERLIDQAVPLVDYYIELAVREEDLSTAQGKAQLVKRLLPIVSEIDDPIERRHYVSRLAMKAGVTERQIDAELEGYTRNLSRANRRRQQTQSHDGDANSEAESSGIDDVPTAERPFHQQAIPKSLNTQHEERILAYLLAHPEILVWADNELAEMRLCPISAEDFENTANRAIFDAQHEFLYSVTSGSAQDMLDRVDAALANDFEKIWSQAQSLSDLPDERIRKDLVDVLLRLRHRRSQQMCQRLEILIRDAEEERESRFQLGQRLIIETRETCELQKAIAARSHSVKWINNHARYAT